MALASFGLSFMNPNSSGLGSSLGKILSVLSANAPYLEAYKREYGIAPPGQLVTLSNGVQGHFTGEADPASGQPMFQIDFTPQAFSDAAVANYNAQQAGAPAPYPQPIVAQPPPPASVFPGAPAPKVPASMTAAQGQKPFFGIPPIALVAAGGLLVFLIARRL